ncbi:MAG: SMC-Scp complex subunit ScpB [Candidatus Hydrothermales bacterium]
METERNLKRVIEALLFVSSRPITLEKLAKLTGFPREKIKEEIDNLKMEYDNEKRAVVVKEVAGGYAFFTREEYSDYVKKLKGDNTFRFSKAMLQTLAIIAYKQPITKAEIEILKGSSVDFTLKSLLEKGLVRVVGRKKIKGAPLLYGTSEKFLKIFGLNSLDELPKVENLR